jgi:hypothetical protein
LLQPAGIASHTHSARLLTDAGAAGAAIGGFSDPEILNSIIQGNRSFCWGATAFDQVGFPTTFGILTGSSVTTSPTSLGCNGASDNEDLAVLPRLSGFQLNPTFSDLSSDAAVLGVNYDPTNLFVDPSFITPYPTTDVGQTINQPEATVPQTAAAFDEGGNFIDVRFGPLQPTGNYHIDGNSPVLDQGSNFALGFFLNDFDFQVRPQGVAVDMGADEAAAAAGGVIPPAIVDTDGDGFADSADNCVAVANPGQEDSDGDNYGDACDGDFNNNGIVDFGDFGIFAGLFGQTGPKGDFNQDGSVDMGDFSTFSSMFGNPPGPSGL